MTKVKVLLGFFQSILLTIIIIPSSTTDSDYRRTLSFVSDSDAYSFLDTRNDNKSGYFCMKVNASKIPSGETGTVLYKGTCNPGPTSTSQCKRYVAFEYEDQAVNKSCLAPTNFVCDPLTKTCLCGAQGNVISQTRFQVGRVIEGKDHTNGICFIRPTMETIPGGFPCAPNTKHVATKICECDEDVNTEDHDWWECRGSAMGGLGAVTLICALAAHFVCGVMGM